MDTIFIAVSLRVLLHRWINRSRLGWEVGGGGSGVQWQKLFWKKWWSGFLIRLVLFYWSRIIDRQWGKRPRLGVVDWSGAMM